MSTEIRFHFTSERAETLKVGHLRQIERIQAGEPVKLNLIVPVMAHFMLNGSGYLAQADAEAVLDDLTGVQLAQVSNQFMEQMRLGAVPLASALPSPEASTPEQQGRDG